MFAFPGLGSREEERRDGAPKEREANRFRCRREGMIEQFTITNPAIGYCCLLFTPQCHIKQQHAKGMNILRSNFETYTEIERGRAGHYARQCLSGQGARRRVGKVWKGPSIP